MAEMILRFENRRINNSSELQINLNKHSYEE
jgi:hypothetical protein